APMSEKALLELVTGETPFSLDSLARLALRKELPTVVRTRRYDRYRCR
ncbi:MAG: hypothetical protein J07HR59_01645, partial [Halorubrum sp. J07HR59]